MTRRARWVRRTAFGLVGVLVLAAGGFSLIVIRDPALRGVPLGTPTGWPVIVLEEAAAPSTARWAALARSQPPPAPVRACAAPRPRVPVPAIGDTRYCGRAQGQVTCPRSSLETPERAQSCAVHATRVAEALLRRGNADAAWAWWREARIILGLGAGQAADPGTALDFALRIRQLDLDITRLLPWFPPEEALQAAVAALEPAGDTATVRAVRAADWQALAAQLGRDDLAPVWRTDSVAAAILARAWHGVRGAGSQVDPCPATGRFWERICTGGLTVRSARDPASLELDVAREDARAYRSVQRRRVDSLLDVWRARQPALVPGRVLLVGSDSRLGRFLLGRAGANGLAMPWPRVVVLDVGRSLDRIASTLAHELGHHSQFSEIGAWRTLRMGEALREAEADAWGRAFLCRVGGPSLGRLGGRCPQLPGE